MSFLKAVTIITLWLVLSFFWVSMGQSQERQCSPNSNLENMLRPHPVLADWHRFCVKSKACEMDGKELFQILAGNETLSTKLNQARVKFEQFYIPISHLMALDWGCLSQEEIRDLQSDLTLINHSLGRVLSSMSTLDSDFLRATVLLDHPSDFV